MLVDTKKCLLTFFLSNKLKGRYFFANINNNKSQYRICVKKINVFMRIF